MDNFGRPVSGGQPAPQQPVGGPQPPAQPAQPPQQPLPQPPAQGAPVLPATEPAQTVSSVASPQPLRAPASKPKRKKWLFFVIPLILILVALGTVFGWYQAQLQPVDSTNTDKQRVAIVAGTTPDQIASQLQEAGLIRSETAFLWYTRIEGVQNQLQAGTYRLSPSETTQEIVGHLKNGSVDTFSMTFIPGQTVRQYKEVFISAGFTEAEVDRAFAASYDSPLFEGKPATADLEGFIFPDTYTFGSGTTAEAALEFIFANFNKVIEENSLREGFAAQNLTLFEGIVMASIIEKEAVGGDERQIAQVFLKRYGMGMMLGSDPTYQYITDKLGVPRDLNYDSLYNTRRYAGIPPGPIAAPGVTSLKAVADPAPGEFLYFLSGDDDVTYFSLTFEEHERNIVQHCKIKCQAL